VDLSGVIFVVLALVWAGYLLPKALRHSDEVARTRSVEEVSERARVVVTPPPPRAGRVRRFRRTRPGDTPMSPGAVAARRRRRILAVLLLAFIGTGVAAVVAVLPVWAPAVPGALVVAFLVLCRVLVRRDRARRLAPRRTAAPEASAPAQPVAARAQPVDQPADAPVATAAAQPTTVSAAVPAEAPVGSLDDTGAFDELVVGVPAQRAVVADGQSGSLWDPLPVTLPTYVGKPRAMRSVRTISLGDPGVSSSGRDAADSALVAGSHADAGGQPGEAPRVVGG
jgi:hypothetical protein